MLKAQVVVTFLPDAGMREVLTEELADVAEIVYLRELPASQRLKILSAADAVLGWGLDRELTSPQELEALGSAKLLQVLSAGVDGLPFQLIPPAVPIASNAGAWAAPMAEHVLAMTLALAKHLVQKHHDLQEGFFNQRRPNLLIGSCVVGIVGLGGVGKATAKLFKAFGAHIYAINRSGRSEKPVDWIGPLDDLGRLLSQADVLVLAVPLNRYTRGLIGRRELELMKRDAILVNVARAAIVDEDALFDHLRRYPEFSAGIDVWWQEGAAFTPRRPFLDLPNVIGSPHNSANTYRSLSEAVRYAGANVARALRNEPVENLVDRRDYFSA